MEKITALYLHIPFCISKCNYCDFFSITDLDNKKVPENYIEALCNEISFKLNKYEIKTLNTVYIGGGTPSLLSYIQLKKIFSSFNKYLSKNAEISIEANPDDITEELLVNYKKIGISRISVGIQSLNSKCLIYSNRRATAEQNLSALKLLCQHFPNYSIDVICGLPEETEESFISNLKTIISYKPKHISMYSLTIEEETPFGKKLDNGELDYDFDFADKLWLSARKILEKSGYPQYEVSNFAISENECKHNLIYWNHKSYLGCGAGATGTLYKKDGTGIRESNINDVSKYISYWKFKENIEKPAIRESIDLDTSKFEFFMMGLRKSQGISNSEFLKIFNLPLPDKFLELSKQWNEKKLMNIINQNGETFYQLNNEGILFLNNFLKELL